jgi:beta-lactamase class A
VTIQEQLSRIQNEFSGRYALFAEHLGTGEIVQFGTMVPMETASTIKLPILVETLRQVEQGALSLETPVTLEHSDMVEGSGVLQALSPGLTLALRDVLTLMITVSDNVATNMVLRIIGLSSVNYAMQALGLRDTEIKKRIDFTLPGPLGLSTPYDLVLLLKGIHQRTLISSKASEVMYAILRQQQYNTLLTRYLPYDLLNSDTDDAPVRIASKSGSLRGVRNDAGLINTPWGDVALAIMSEGAEDLRFHTDNEAMVVLPHASRAIFDYFITAKRPLTKIAQCPIKG